MANGNGNGMQTNGAQVPASMSRSMIEPELLSKPGQMVQHGQGGDATSSSLVMNGNHFQPNRMNGHARLSIPPQSRVAFIFLMLRLCCFRQCPWDGTHEGFGERGVCHVGPKLR